MSLADLRFFRPLECAENHFLEVLVSSFELSRFKPPWGDYGIRLDLSFDNRTEAITQRLGKDEAKRRMKDFSARARQYQKELDEFIFEHQGPDLKTFAYPDFFFRYASGGTLPILKIGDQKFFCLFYRDVFPVGWNIANGATDSRRELLNPLEAIERELREELIIINPQKKLWYVFPDVYGLPPDRPEFEVARRLWKEKFGEPNFHKLEKSPQSVTWLTGPDILSLIFNNQPQPPQTGFYLNINALDFGIEFDKVAEIEVDEDDIICDGELIKDSLLNRPVGLFEINRLQSELKAGKTEFIPDRFFYNAKRYDDGFKIKRVIVDEALPEIKHLRRPEQIQEYADTQDKYDLCPVTRRILGRYLGLRRSPIPSDFPTATGPAEFFISFSEKDENYARKVNKFLRDRGKTTFFCKESLVPSDLWMDKLYEALRSACCLIPVATSLSPFQEGWVREECRCFHKLIVEGDKHKKIAPFIAGFAAKYLPDFLSHYQAVTFEPGLIEDSLPLLEPLLRHPCPSQ
ncbi:MAG: toll/interleukin-1 receptor domain-containing protein [Deltaproteobacteria bacterium]|nr:toll/interleukin-1 receptor domain-containing protein [Deltaproteobacteria bacterium]